MENQEKSTVALAKEQLDALAQSFLPVMQEFFRSERGRRIWEEYLREAKRGNDSAT